MLALLAAIAALTELGRSPFVGSGGAAAQVGRARDDRGNSPLVVLMCSPEKSGRGSLDFTNLGPCNNTTPEARSDPGLFNEGEAIDSRLEATIQEELLAGASPNPDHTAQEGADPGRETRVRPRRMRRASPPRPAKSPEGPGYDVRTSIAFGGPPADAPATAPRTEFVDMSTVVLRELEVRSVQAVPLDDYNAKKKAIARVGKLPEPVTEALASGGLPIYRFMRTRGDVGIVVKPTWPFGVSVGGKFY